MNLAKIVQKQFSTAAATAEKPASKKISFEQLKKSRALNFNLTSDLYRVDLGLLLSRSPIYMRISDAAMKNEKLHHNFYQSTKNNMPITQSLIDFEFKDPLQAYRGRMDESDTHRSGDLSKSDLQGDKKSQNQPNFYKENSKFWQEVDPTLDDNRSIQYNPALRVYLVLKKKDADTWSLPSMVLPGNRFMDQSLDDLLVIPFEPKLRPYFKIVDLWPTLVTKKPIDEAEFEVNKLWRKCAGRKIFYFNAYHVSGGTMHLNKDVYDDYAWVSRLELGDYLNNEDYQQVVHG